MAALRHLLIALPLLAIPVRAQESISDAQRAQMEALRAQVAGQIQLQAFDLLDELVYSWNEHPVFATDTAVVLADVTVPVGFGSGLQALIENHFFGLVSKNPRSRVQLSYCPQCTAVMVHAGSKGTVISRGVDQPEALFLAGVAAGSRHALFLDFEAEGSALVLRARMTSLAKTLPIVYARTLSTATSAAALLRVGERLKSAQEAHDEYLEALSGRGVLVVPLRLGVRTYAPPLDTSGIRTPPVVWLQIGAELGLTQARAWTAGLTLGGTYLPAVQTGWLAQARFSRLLTGSAVSLTNPDVYAFLGGSLIAIPGPGSLLFRGGEELTPADLLIAATGVGSIESIFPALQIGLEGRVKNRIAIAVFLEAAPTLNDSFTIGNFLDIGILRFQAVGAEVSLCF